MNAQEIPEVDQQPNAHAVSLYAQDEALDDFPVLKAFQQYIDAEQAKARKRVLSLCIFFGCLMSVVIAVFVGMLMHMSERNQSLNDRLVEYAMNCERNQGSAVVVQPPQDNSALFALTAKIEALQKKMAEDQAKAEKAAQEAAEQARKAAAEAAKPKEPTSEEKEIQRLRSLLASEKEKNSLEKERQRQAEIEAYRRKYYPELYETPKPKARSAQKRRAKAPAEDTLEDVDAEIEAILSEEEAIDYFDEEGDEEVSRPSRTKKKVRQAPPSEPEKEYSIPVDIKGSSTRWNIPND